MAAKAPDVKTRQRLDQATQDKLSDVIWKHMNALYPDAQSPAEVVAMYLRDKPKVPWLLLDQEAGLEKRTDSYSRQHFTKHIMPKYIPKLTSAQADELKRVSRIRAVAAMR